MSEATRLVDVVCDAERQQHRALRSRVDFDTNAFAENPEIDRINSQQLFSFSASEVGPAHVHIIFKWRRNGQQNFTQTLCFVYCKFSS